MHSKAVFLDRDGVLNRLVWNSATGAYESPHTAADLDIFPFVPAALRQLSAAGYHLFLVSNQPSYAKGKTTLGNILAVHAKLDIFLKANAVRFTGYYYCYHHPAGVVPAYTRACRCRKPSPFFIIQAQQKYRLDTARSWMVGDQDSDIFCGRNAGTQTMLIEEEKSVSKRGGSSPDHRAPNLQKAVEIILAVDKED